LDGTRSRTKCGGGHTVAPTFFNSPQAGQKGYALAKPVDHIHEQNGVEFDLSGCDIEEHDGGTVTERSINLFQIRGEDTNKTPVPFGKGGEFCWNWMQHVPASAEDRFGVHAHIFEKYEPFSGDEPVYSLHFNDGCDDPVEHGAEEFDINLELRYMGSGGLGHALHWAYRLVEEYKQTERGAQVFQFGTLDQPDYRDKAGKKVYDETFELLFDK